MTAKMIKIKFAEVYQPNNYLTRHNLDSSDGRAAHSWDNIDPN